MKDLTVPLDPRHPTRHRIWTPAADYLQDRVCSGGPRLRLDVTRCFACNAAAKQADGEEPDWEWERGSLPARVDLFRTFWRYTDPDRHHLQIGHLRVCPEIPRDNVGVQTVRNYDANRVDVFPLLHAHVVRRNWHFAGLKFSGWAIPNPNYFEYAGHALGDVLLAHGRHLPIWRD